MTTPTAKTPLPARSVGSSLVAVLPNLRYFSLGVFLAWMFLVVDYGAWMTRTDSTNLAVIDTGMHVYLFSSVTLIASAFAQQRIAALFSRRYAPALIAGICIVGTVLLIASGPRFLAPWSLSSTLFQIGSTLAGIGSAFMILWIGRLFCDLEPSKVILYAALSELLVAVIFYIVIGNSWLAPISDGPPLSNLLAVLLLPVAATWLAALPAPSGLPRPDRAQESETVSASLLFRSFPMMAKLMIAVLVFSAVASIVWNFFMLDQPPDTHQLYFQQAMLLRFLFAFLLVAVALFLLKDVALGKLYLFCMGGLALVVAALPLLNLPTSFPLVFTNALSSISGLIVWCLLSFMAKSSGFSAPLVFGLGEGFAHAGSGLGYVCGYCNVFELAGASGEGIGTPFTVMLIALIIACFALVFTEKDIDTILEASGATHLNVREILVRNHEPRGSKPTDRPWQRACRIVGERGMLSSREQELLIELTRNRSPQEIASQLSITVSTVRTHTHRIYVKLDVHSRDELIALVKEEFSSETR